MGRTVVYCYKSSENGTAEGRGEEVLSRVCQSLVGRLYVQISGEGYVSNIYCAFDGIVFVGLCECWRSVAAVEMHAENGKIRFR